MIPPIILSCRIDNTRLDFSPQQHFDKCSACKVKHETLSDKYNQFIGIFTVVMRQAILEKHFQEKNSPEHQPFLNAYQLQTSRLKKRFSDADTAILHELVLHLISYAPIEKPSKNLLKFSTFVIFLDIDGVLSYNIRQELVRKKASELFPEADGDFSHNQLSQATAHFFNPDAVKNLEFLIKEMDKTARVWIVLSSSWREGRTIKALREKYFNIYHFGKYIVDKTIESVQVFKTPDDTDVVQSTLHCPSGIHDLSMSPCRASEIQEWLIRHPQFKHFVVVDDADNHILDSFPDKFSQTDTVLTKEHVEKILMENALS